MPAIKLPPAITTGLKALGVDPTELLRRAGLPLTLFSTGQILVTTEQLFALWQGIGELSGDPAIGLNVADQVPWLNITLPASLLITLATFVTGCKEWRVTNCSVVPKKCG